MKSLLLTDLHLSNKSFKGVSLLDYQVDCINSIIEKEKPHEIIIMGDIFTQRRPSPSALLALKGIIDRSRKYASSVIMLRGNHDSETKSDDGVTALSLFNDYEVLAGRFVKVVTHTHVCYKTARMFIPHYENQETILKALKDAPAGFEIFGHFGFVGCLNSAGDKDFDISPSNFNNITYLGHIHKHIVEWNGEHPITVVGTPYTTNFGEEGKASFYGVKGEVEEYYEFKSIDCGPHHMGITYKNLIKDFKGFKKSINESKFSVLLRIVLEKDDVVDHSVLDELDVVYMDFRFSPIEEKDCQDQSEYRPERNLFSINDQIIEDYVEKHNSSLDKEEIMWGLGILKNEDK